MNIEDLRALVASINAGDRVRATWEGPGWRLELEGEAHRDGQKVAILGDDWMHVEHLSWTNGDLNRRLIRAYVITTPPDAHN